MICGRLLYIRLPSSCPPTCQECQDAQSRCFPSLCPLPFSPLSPAPTWAKGRSSQRETRALPAPFSRIFFPHPPTAPTQLARLFIKTSKLTGFNRVCFTLFITSVYYLLRRPIPATSFRSLILSHKSRPPKIPPPAPLAVRFHPLLFHSTSSFFSMPYRLHHPPSIVQPLVM